MDDEAMGQFAKALLDDLGDRSSYEGKILTLARGIRHVEACAIDEATRPPKPRIADLPGWEPLSNELRAIWTTPDGGTSIAHKTPEQALPGGVDRDTILLPHWHPHWSRLAREDIAGLLATAPGPITTCARHLAALAGHAHLACQWGHLDQARLMLWCCAGLLNQIRDPEVDEHVERPQLSMSAIVCGVGGLAAERKIAITATTLARRATADLGAVARAAARLEGRPDLDPVFEEEGSDSVRGADPLTAAAAALEIGRGLARHAPKALPPPHTQRRRMPST